MKSGPTAMPRSTSAPPAERQELERAVGTELRDERVEDPVRLRASAEGGSDHAGGGEIGGIGLPDDIRVAVGVHGDAVGDYRSRPTEQRRVIQARVDDEGVARVVARTDGKAVRGEVVSVPRDREAALHRHLTTIDHLVARRPLVGERSQRAADQEVAGPVDGQPAPIRQPDVVHAGAGRPGTRTCRLPGGRADRCPHSWYTTSR
jgi:hypothetical protein